MNKEYIKCKNDIQYFMETYCMIRTPYEYQLIKLYNKQKECLVEYQNKEYSYIKLHRQKYGISTISMLYILHYALFELEEGKIIITSHNHKSAILLFDILRTVINNLPNNINVKLTVNKIDGISFNSVDIVYSPVNSLSKYFKKDVKLVYFDNYEYYDSKLMNEYDVVGNFEGKMIMTSTY